MLEFAIFIIVDRNFDTIKIIVLFYIWKSNAATGFQITKAKLNAQKAFCITEGKPSI